MVVVLTAQSVAEAGRPKAAQVSPKSREGHCEGPVWSRDGKLISYERSFRDSARARVELNLLHAPLEDPREERIRIKGGGSSFVNSMKGSSVKQGQICRELAWGPLEVPDTYVFSCNVKGGTYQLFYDGAQITRGEGAAGQPALTPEGWMLAYVATVQGREGLFLVPNLGEPEQSKRLLPSNDRVDRMPTWSPDGKALTFVGHSNKSADIYLIPDIKKPRAVKLTDWPEEELNPSWSPDGDRIAFYSNHKGAGRGSDGYGLYVVEAKAGAKPVLVAKNVKRSEQHGRPAWSPDGRWLIYVKDFQKGRVVNPIRAARTRPSGRLKEVKLKTGTVSNEDPHAVEADGEWWLTFSALGTFKSKRRTWRKIYVFPLKMLQDS